MFAAEVVDVSPYSHLVKTFVATDAVKAYYNVGREGIIKNMKEIGIPTSITRMLHSLLRDREFTIRVNGKTVGSSSNTGVPQGSVLANTLFNLAIISLAWQLEKDNINLIIYADDVIIWSTHTDLKTQLERLEDVLNQLDEYRESQVSSCHLKSPVTFSSQTKQ